MISLKLIELKYIFIFSIIFNFSFGVKLTIKEAANRDRYFVESDSLMTLTCVSDSISQREIVNWYLPSDPTTPFRNMDARNPASVREEIEGSRKHIILSIRGVTNQYKGTYYCRSYLNEGLNPVLLGEAKIYVSLFKPISVKLCRMEQWIQINTKSSLTCTLFSDPTATVTWSLKNITLSQSLKYKINSWGIEISDVAFTDAGHYIVSARQIDHTSSLIRDIIVKVFELPKITSVARIIGPITNGVMEFQYSDIQCHAEGNPPPTIHWFRNKSDIEVQYTDPKKYYVNTNPKVGTMRIYRPEYPDDNDNYYCQAMINNPAIDQNIINWPRSNIKVTVSVMPQFLELDQMHHLVKPGRTATIRCKVRMNDPFELMWQRYEGVLYKIGKQTFDPRIEVSQYSEPNNELNRVLVLQISDVRFEDSWNYTCIATTPGFNMSYNGSVQVHQKPVLSNNTALEEHGWLFNGTNLTCKSYGFPYANWRWSRNFYTIENEPNSTFAISWIHYQNYSQSWLQITPDDRSQFWIYNSRYKCTAYNDLGFSTHDIKFLEAQPPAAPSISISDITSSSVKLLLQSPKNTGGKPLLHYELIYRASQGRTVSYGPVIYYPAEGELKNWAKVVEMRGLIHDTSYHVNVYACSIVGRSSEPQSLVIRTKGASVPYPVEITSQPISNYPYAYTIRWKVPLNGGLPITGYRFNVIPMVLTNRQQSNSSLVNFIRNLKDFDPLIHKSRTYNPVLFNPYMDYFRLDDLEPLTMYKVIIEASNKRGFSNGTIFYFLTPHPDSLGKPARVRGGQCGLQPGYFIQLIVISVFFSYLIF